MKREISIIKESPPKMTGIYYALEIQALLDSLNFLFCSLRA